MANLTELRARVYRDLAQSSTANDRLPTATVDTMLNTGYTELAKEVYRAATVQADKPRGLFTRTASIAAVDDQATYTTPQDMLAVRHVAYNAETAYLTRATKQSLDYRDIEWRGTVKGTSEWWYPDDQRKFGLYVKPTVGGTPATIYVEGQIEPFSVGGGIAGAARATNVVTVTTNLPHLLTTKDTPIVIYGVTAVASMDGTFTLASVPTATTFTFAQTGGNETATVATGVAGYSNGVLPLYVAGDRPAFNAAYHYALAEYAVWTLGFGLFADDPVAATKAGAAKERFDAAVAELAAGLHG